METKNIDGADRTYSKGMWHTDDQGGQGPHCATNCTLVEDFSKPSKTRWRDENGACTMYYAGSMKRTNGVFCANCIPRLKRADLGHFNMLNKSWDKY